MTLSGHIRHQSAEVHCPEENEPLGGVFRRRRSRKTERFVVLSDSSQNLQIARRARFAFLLLKKLRPFRRTHRLQRLRDPFRELLTIERHLVQMRIAWHLGFPGCAAFNDSTIAFIAPSIAHHSWQVCGVLVHGRRAFWIFCWLRKLSPCRIQWPRPWQLVRTVLSAFAFVAR